VPYGTKIVRANGQVNVDSPPQRTYNACTAREWTRPEREMTQMTKYHVSAFSYMFGEIGSGCFDNIVEAVRFGANCDKMDHYIVLRQKPGKRNRIICEGRRA